MSLDNYLIGEESPFEGELEYDFEAIFQTVHANVPPQNFNELGFPQDSIERNQITSNAHSHEGLVKKADPNSSGPSASPSTDEGVSSSHESRGYEDTFVSQTSSDQTSSYRAKFEKLIPSVPQSSPDHFYLDRDPSELRKSAMPVLFNSYEEFQIDTPLSFTSSEAMMNSDLVSSPESYEFVFHGEAALDMPLPRPQQLPLTNFNPAMFRADFQEPEIKPSDSRQSKYKNAYSLAEEQGQRYLGDWLELTKTSLKKVYEEEKKSAQVRIQEARKLESVIKVYDCIDQESNNLKSRIKDIETAAKKGNGSKDELPKLVRDRDILLGARKSYQKALTENLQYKRFGLTPTLSKLVNDSPNAFIKREDLAKYVNEHPTTRTLKSMREFFNQNIKFGLLASKVTIDLLTSKPEPTMMSNSTVELKYWLVKSPMENKNKKLFSEMISRNHVKDELQKVYLELVEKAKTQVSESDMKLFNEVFNGQGRDMNVEYAAENEFSGKRAIEFVPSGREQGAKKTKKN